MKDDRNHRLFDRQMLEEIRQRRADQQIQPSPEEDGMFQGKVTARNEDSRGNNSGRLRERGRKLKLIDGTDILLPAERVIDRPDLSHGKHGVFTKETN